MCLSRSARLHLPQNVFRKQINVFVYYQWISFPFEQVTPPPVYKIHFSLFTQSYITSTWRPSLGRILTCCDQSLPVSPSPPGFQMAVCIWAWASVLCDMNAYGFISRLWHICHVLLSGTVPLDRSGQRARALVMMLSDRWDLLLLRRPCGNTKPADRCEILPLKWRPRWGIH